MGHSRVVILRLSPLAQSTRIDSGRARRRTRVIVQHPHRRSVEVIELPAPSARDERDDRGEDDERRQRHDNEDHAHDTRSFGNVSLSHDASTTVSELAGMSTAAISGVITPVTASVAPITL